MVAEAGSMQGEIAAPRVTAALVFKHWCRAMVPAAAAVCPRYGAQLHPNASAVPGDGEDGDARARAPVRRHCCLPCLI
jgi:hypothetical protein